MIGGKELTQIVDRILAERGISRVDFCKEIGISSAAYSGWKKGSQPREDKIIAIEKCLTLTFRGKKLREINKWGEKQSLFTPRILVTRTGLEPKTKVQKPA